MQREQDRPDVVTATGGAAIHRGPFLVLVAAMLWGTTGTSQALAPTGATPPVIGALRLVIGGAALLALALARGRLRGGGRWPLVTTGIAAAAVAAYQVLFFGGVARTGVAIGTIVGIGSAPVMGGLLGFLVRGERPRRIWFVSTALAITGCVALALSGGEIGVDIVGIILALGAGWAYATYTVASKNLLENHPPDAVMAVIFCLGALLLAPLLFVADLGWIARPRGLAVVLHLGLIATGLSYVLFARGLRTVTTATAVTLTLAEPLTAGILGVVLLGEQLTITAPVGIGLLFAGLYLLTARRGTPPS